MYLAPQNIPSETVLTLGMEWCCIVVVVVRFGAKPIEIMLFQAEALTGADMWCSGTAQDSS